MRLRQHSTKKLLVQCWPKAYRHVFARKLATQCCLDLREPTLHKKITFAMLVHSPRTNLHWKIIYSFVWICLGQHCIRELLAQCWPRDKCKDMSNIFSNVSGSLFFNWIYYHRTVLALLVQCWLRSSFTACRTTMNRSRYWLEQI